MAQVTFELTAKQENAVRGMLQVEAAMGKVTAETTRMSSKSKEAQSSFDTMTTKAKTGLMDISAALIGPIGIGVALTALISKAKEFGEAVAKAGEDAAAGIRKATAIAAVSGGVSATPGMTKMFQAIGDSSGQSDDAIMRIFEQVKAAAPTLSNDAIMQVTSLAARKGAPIFGMDEGKQTALASTMALLKSFSPGMSLDDLGDTGLGFMRATGGKGLDAADVRAMGQLTTAGIAPDMASALALAAGRSGQQIKQLGGVADLLTAKGQFTKDMSAEEMSFYLEDDPRARLNMIMSNQAVRGSVMGNAAGEFQTLLTRGQPLLMMEGLRVGRSRDVLSRESARALADPDIMRALDIQSNRVQAGESLETDSAQNIALARSRRLKTNAGNPVLQALDSLEFGLQSTLGMGASGADQYNARFEESMTNAVHKGTTRALQVNRGETEGPTGLF